MGEGTEGAEEKSVTQMKKAPKISGLFQELIGRGERIRTSDSCVPNAVLYQAELRPDGKLVARKDIAGTGLIFQPGNSSLQTLR